MSGSQHPVFVVGVGTDVLSLVRIFGAKGVPCWVCSSQRVPGALSRYARYFPVADPREDEERMIADLVALARQQSRPPVIFTGCDQHAQALARHRDRLREVALPCIARSEVVDLLVHKADFSVWASDRIASYPRSVPACLFRPCDGLDFPVVAKTNHRGFSNAGKLGLPSEEDLHERRFSLISTAEDWTVYQDRNRDFLLHILIQEYVSGTSASKFSVCLYADANSRIRALFVGRRLRGYPALYGDASLLQSDAVPREVLDEVAAMVELLGYQGIAEAEFNCDDRTGRYRLLEMNPRCWGWIGITGATECNIPWIAYRDLIGEAIAPRVVGPDPGTIKMVYLVQDAASVFLRYRWNYPEWVMSPRAWWRSLRADQLVVWEIDRHDWQGTVVCFATMAIKAVKSVFRQAFRKLAALCPRS